MSNLTLPAWAMRPKFANQRLTLTTVCAITVLFFIFLFVSDTPDLNTDGLERFSGLKILTGTQSGAQKRILLKVGGIPSEGFGATLAYIRPAMNVASALELDFQVVRSFDFENKYNVVDELNVGVDFKRFNWNKMCDLETNSMVPDEAFDHSWDKRIQKVRANYNYLRTESAKFADGVPYDKNFIEKVKSRLANCDVIILADQELHQNLGWNNASRTWVRNHLERNVDVKVRQRKARIIAPTDIHVHYRWGDVAESIRLHANTKWCFNETQAERSIQSVERCLGRDLSTNIYMKRSVKEENLDEMRQIIAPLRPNGSFIEGTDDIVDLVNLSRSRILVLTGGSYSVTAAAIGHPDIIIHNTFAPHQFNFILQDGGILLLQGDELNAEQCTRLKYRQGIRYIH